ncbi:hypothetical protein [Amycolatopsis sp.]|uniref:hypothetical protein n=1 Tax=Amycolatopsis sp. TaxID=37632 RepID=UPI002BC398CD|nr:hypothetical protein [Amycolatopsis sp.]HVV13600.1 hypothetical protein [Amycolatopsis sp.]
MTGFVPDAGQPQTPATGATAGAVGSVLGGMLSAQAIASTKGEVQKLVDSANSGGFAISEEGADEYIRVFRDFEDVIGNVQFTLRDASQAPALGSSPYAQQIASHTQLVATGDQQSYATALQSLGEIVKQARQAFEVAKTRYSQMDDDAKQTFGGVQV